MVYIVCQSFKKYGTIKQYEYIQENMVNQSNSKKRNKRDSVILFPAHPASFAHTFVSGMQSFYISES